MTGRRIARHYVRRPVALGKCSGCAAASHARRHHMPAPARRLQRHLPTPPALEADILDLARQQPPPSIRPAPRSRFVHADLGAFLLASSDDHERPGKSHVELVGDGFGGREVLSARSCASVGVAVPASEVPVSAIAGLVDGADKRAGGARVGLEARPSVPRSGSGSVGARDHQVVLGLVAEEGAAGLYARACARLSFDERACPGVEPDRAHVPHTGHPGCRSRRP